MATAAAQGAPRVLRLRRPRPPTPPANAPQNLRRFPNHRCRGPAAASETGPRSPGRGAEWRGARTQREVSFGARCPSSGPGGRARGGVVQALVGRRGARPSLPPYSPTPVSPLASRDLRRPRAAAAAGLGRRRRRQRRRRRLRGSPCRWAEEEKPFCCGEGTRFAEGRLRLRGEGEPTDPAPGAGRGRSRGCGEQRGGLGGALDAARLLPTAPKAAQVTAKSEESDWPRLYREGGPDRKPGHVTRKRLLPWLARLRSPKCASLTRAAVGSILWREVSVSLCRLLTVLSWAGKVRTSKNHIRAPTTLGAPRGWDGAV